MFALLVLPAQCAVCKSCIVFALLPAQCAVSVCKSRIVFALLPAQYTMCQAMYYVSTTASAVCCVRKFYNNYCVCTTGSTVCYVRTTITPLLCFLNVLPAQFAMQVL